MIQTIYLPISAYSTEETVREALEQDRGHAEQELDDALGVGYSIVSSTSMVQDGRTWLVYVLHHPTDRPVEQLNDDELAVLDNEQIERILERVLDAAEGKEALKTTVDLLVDAGIDPERAPRYANLPPDDVRQLLRQLGHYADMAPLEIEVYLMDMASTRARQNGGAL